MDDDDVFDLSKGQGICTSVHGADRGKAEYMVRAVQQLPPSPIQSVSNDARCPPGTLLRLPNACGELQAIRSMR